MLKSNLVHQAPPLFGKGPEEDVVFASRVRLARNLAAYPFPGRAGSGELSMVLDAVRETCAEESPVGPLRTVNIWELEIIDRNWFVEQFVISPALVAHPLHRGVSYREDGLISIMINEEDHLRLQAMRPGFDLEAAYTAADRLDDWIGAHLDYAFDENLGFLTTHVANLGTGMRASVMVHLPALAMSGRLEEVFSAAGQLGITIRGLHGEGSEGFGDLFQVSNQFGLGWREEEVVRNVAAVAQHLVLSEREVRQTLRKERRAELEDLAWRAYGTLKFARLLTDQEAMSLLSRVRLGQLLGVLKWVDMAAIKALMVIVQPAVLETLIGPTAREGRMDSRRAQFIREVLPAHD
ncbi:MAG: protein arginine kinase [Armatimonadetes bacterium]|nr:protein arginine kinase [Armatimonadota bacterium]